MYCDFIKYIYGQFYFCRNEDYETEDNYPLIYWLSQQTNLNNTKRVIFHWLWSYYMLFFVTSGILLLTGTKQMI